MRKGLKLITYFFATVLMLTISSCGKPQYVYDQVGLESGTKQNENAAPNSGGAVPNYYYRNAPAASYGNPYQQQAPYYPPQQPYQQAPGGSRFYSDPYAIPPAAYYPTYDADQYYVPPSSYGTDTRDNRNRDPR